MPNEKYKIIFFKNHYRQELVHFVVYADFECNNESINTSQPNPEKSHTKQYQKHVPSGFCCIFNLFTKSFINQRQ